MYVEYERNNFFIGLVASCLGHAVLFYFLLFRLHPNFDFNQTVYSVTLEGGKTLGGISQAPKNDKAQIAPPKKVSGGETKPEAKTPENNPKEAAKAEDDAEVSLAEKKKEEAKKLADEKAKHEKELKEKKAKEEKEKAEKERKKKEEEAKKAKAKATPKAPTAAEINKSYDQAMQRYLGESSDAGGKSFGAGALGGNKMGGGVQRPPEFFAYLDMLKGKIKQAWRWYDTNTSLTARVHFEISPDGRISNVSVVQGSGNSEFDNSVVRAINKVEKLPPPAPNIVQFFSSVNVMFDPRE